MRASRVSLPMLFAVLAAACSGEGPVYRPATMTATLVGPNDAEGAALVVLVGDGVGEVSAVAPTELFVGMGDGSVRLVLVNREGGDLSFRVAVADVTQPPSAVVQQVAGPDDELRAVGDYQVVFAR